MVLRIPGPGSPLGDRVSGGGGNDFVGPQRSGGGGKMVGPRRP